MGSLMSGWNSTVLSDGKKVRLMRNRSLTKEEVDAFWRQHQHGRQDGNIGQQGSPQPSPRRSDEEIPPFETRRLDAIRSLPSSPLARVGQHLSPRSEPSSPAARTEGFPESSAAADSRPSTSCDWWTRSSWAFLNEPPHNNQQEETGTSGRGRAHKAYASDQFVVARILTGNA